MKILLVHNYYGSSAPSGENKVFEAERAMLEKHGHEVAVYTRHSDEIRNVQLCKCEKRETDNSQLGIGRFHISIFSHFHTLKGMIKGALCTVGNPFAARAVARKCREFRPDVVHFHNTFPLISPLAVRAASKYAPVVMTLHNYRMACAAGVPTRNGKVCSLCLDRKCAWDGIKRRCYRGGLLATLPLAINIALYRKRLPQWVSRFIVLSEFQKRKMVAYGWPEEKMAVKGNFLPAIEPRYTLNIRNEEPRPKNFSVFRVFGGSGKKEQIAYVGRLSKEKGVETLIKAFEALNGQGDRGAHPARSMCATRLKNLKLLILGDGVDRAELEEQSKGLPIEFLGQRDHEQTLQLMAESLCVVQPSACWETFGLAAAEAMSVGTPAVVANVGGLPDVVQDGRFGEVFAAGSAEACAAAIKRLLSRPDYEEICKAAPQEARTKYSEEANCRRLMEIYNDELRAEQL